MGNFAENLNLGNRVRPPPVTHLALKKQVKHLDPLQRSPININSFLRVSVCVLCVCTFFFSSFFFLLLFLSFAFVLFVFLLWFFLCCFCLFVCTFFRLIFFFFFYISKFLI